MRARERWTAGLQGAFYLATGVWPVLHLESFMAVTGPKHDLWLVQSFGLVLFSVGGVLLHAAWRRCVDAGLAWVGLVLAVTLLGIDILFVTRGDISRVYLLDGAAELMLALAWIVARLSARGDESVRRRSDHGAFRATSRGTDA
jgi:hypothetical protein